MIVWKMLLELLLAKIQGLIQSGGVLKVSEEGLLGYAVNTSKYIMICDHCMVAISNMHNTRRSIA